MRRLLTITALVLASAMVLGALFWTADRFISKPSPEIRYGLTFSTYFAGHLKLNPEEAYREVIEDLGVKRIRLPLYWDTAENKKDLFDFSEIDRLLKKTPADVQVTLALGYKVPRWPECFPPAWVEDLSPAEKEERVLTFLRRAVEHFKNYPQITAWQIENEPELSFGPCPLLPESFLKTEIELVRSLDSRPIITTDSGELTLWQGPLKYADTMGISLYREVWSKYIGYVRYPLPPLFYRLKAALLPPLWSGKNKEVMISELQAEPWLKDGSPLNVPLEEQAARFSLNDFQKTVNFAERVGFKEQYLWGVEWWYWMKLQGRSEYWNFAKTLFAN